MVFVFFFFREAVVDLLVWAPEGWKMPKRSAMLSNSGSEKIHGVVLGTQFHGYNLTGHSGLREGRIPPPAAFCAAATGIVFSCCCSGRVLRRMFPLVMLTLGCCTSLRVFGLRDPEQKTFHFFLAQPGAHHPESSTEFLAIAGPVFPT